MSDRKEECGIAATYHLGGENVSRLVPRMLLDLQNRGQSAAGMTSYSAKRRPVLLTHKELGLVSEIFFASQMARHDELVQRHAGPAAIGHVRYVTQGENRVCDAQPLERYHFRKTKWFSFAFNGNIANYRQLMENRLADGEINLTGDTDTELIVYEISRIIGEQLHGRCKQHAAVDHVGVCRELAKRLDGAYCITYLTARGELVVARDPHGLKPLCFAFDGSLFAAASESVALFNLGFTHEQIKPVEPGTMLLVTRENGIETHSFVEQIERKHCFFEWVYFANVASKIDTRSVYLARKRLGEELAKREKIAVDDNTVVVPVPDTSKAAADGMAYALGVPCLEGLIRNRYSGRTFIEAGEYRQKKAESKYTPLPEVLEGKRVFLVEDSIVRSTTMRVLLRRLRDIGRVAEIHVRVACPPIVAPCFYGIDMPTFRELFASSYFFDPHENFQPPCDLSLEHLASLEPAMAKTLGADSLHYLDMNAVARAIGFESRHFCTGCVSGQYPTPTGNLRAIEQRNNAASIKKGTGY